MLCRDNAAAAGANRIAVTGGRRPYAVALSCVRRRAPETAGPLALGRGYSLVPAPSPTREDGEPLPPGAGRWSVVTDANTMTGNTASGNALNGFVLWSSDDGVLTRNRASVRPSRSDEPVAWIWASAAAGAARLKRYQSRSAGLSSVSPWSVTLSSSPVSGPMR